MTITGRMNLQVLLFGTAVAVLSASATVHAARGPRADAPAAGEKVEKAAKVKAPPGPIKRGAIKVATVIATPLAMITYAMPSTQTQLLAGRVEAKGDAAVRAGKSGTAQRLTSKALKACSFGLYCAERLAIINVLPGGAEAGDLAQTAENLFMNNPANGAIFVTANLALAPLTIDQFKKAINTGRLSVVAKEFGTTRADVAAVTEVAQRLGYKGTPDKPGGISESRAFFNMLQAERVKSPGAKMADLALLVAVTHPPASAVSEPPPAQP